MLSGACIYYDVIHQYSQLYMTEFKQNRYTVTSLQRRSSVMKSGGAQIFFPKSEKQKKKKKKKNVTKA